MKLKEEILLYLFQFSLSEYIVLGKQVPTLTFQADDIPTTYSWAKSSTPFPELKSYSVCFYIKILRARPTYSSIISYAVPSDANEIYMGFNFPTGRFDVWKNMMVLFISSYQVNILTWTKLCYVQSFAKEKRILWINDMEESFSSNLSIVEGGGSFFLGQDQDEMDTGFSFDQSLNAIITNFHFFNREIDHDEAIRFINCNSKFTFSSFLNFENQSNWVLNDTVKFGNMLEEEICAPINSFYLMFPEKRTLEKTVHMCSKYAAELPLPKNEQENSEIIPLMENYKDICSDGNGNFVWLPISVKTKDKAYFNYYNKSEISYKNYIANDFVEGVECTTIIMFQFVMGKWLAAKCSELVCGICKSKNVTIVKLRGLCDNTIFDNIFFVYEYENRKPHFKGYHFSDLKWAGETWVMEYLYDRSVTAQMIMQTGNDYPLGIHEWNISGDKCVTEGKTTTTLILTACKDGDYTCDDGSCILMIHRCDMILHCQDQSDEIDCEFIMIPSSYIDLLPPPETNGSSHSGVKVEVNVSVTSIRSFSLTDFTLSYDLAINLKWRDSRLTFKNLKEDEDQNQVSSSSAEKIWTPGIYLEDDFGSKVTITDHGSQTFIFRASAPIPDNIQRLKEDKLYKGSENYIIQRRILTASFLCQFDLVNYPFDLQTCNLILKAMQRDNRVMLIGGKAEFLGVRKLLEYQMSEICLESNSVNGYSKLNIRMEFFNLFKYYIFGTYIPTTLIVIITYMAFFFALSDFTNRIMVSLTALMVLAALFLQTSQGVARTAYMKLIDIWFLFCMIFNFAIILALIFLNYKQENGHSFSPLKITPQKLKRFLSDKESQNDKKDMKQWIDNPEKLSIKRWIRTPEKLNGIFIWLFPILFLIFTCGYILVIGVEWKFTSK